MKDLERCLRDKENEETWGMEIRKKLFPA
jgi:hypothetical protein